MQKTQNYNLNQWEPADPIRRADFNADNAAIDAALGSLNTAVPKIAVGTYTGNGSATKAKTIAVGFAPKMVFVWANRSATTSSYDTNYCGMTIQGQTLQDILILTDTGFQVMNATDYNGYQKYPYLNASITYFYFAIG